jgi:hypothetical protein
MEVKCRAQTEFPEEFKTQRSWNDPFRSDWSSTLHTLEFELQKLGASYAIIELAIGPQDIRLDGWPKAHARASHPGVVVSFDSKYGDLRYGTDRYPNWQANVRAIALGLEALRKVDRYGISRRGEQYKGWAQLTAGGGSMSPDEAIECLEAWGGEKKALMRTHPDTREEGATDEDFERVQQARSVLGKA